MKIAISLVLFELATSATVNVKTCGCVAAINSADCLLLQNGACFWTGKSCIQGRCSDITGPSISTCNKYGCVYKTNGCVPFAQCSDYSVTDPTQCAAYYYSLTQSCVAGKANAGLYPCKNGPTTAAPNCSTGLSTTCKSISYSDTKCGWNGTACVAYSPQKCSDHTPYGQESCPPGLCVWSSSACLDKTCANQTTNCGSFYNYAMTQITLCSGTPCAEVPVSTLTQDTCVLYTGGGSIWTASNVCTTCHALAILAISILILLF